MNFERISCRVSCWPPPVRPPVWRSKSVKGIRRHGAQLRTEVPCPCQHRARCRVTGAGHKHPAPRCRRGSPGGEEEQRQLQPALTTRPGVEGGSGCFSFPVSPRFFKTLGCTVEQSTGDVPDVLLTLKFLRNYRDSLH